MQKQDKAFPELRFPEFSAEWHFKTLSELAMRVTNKNIDRQVASVLTNSATKGVVKQTDYFDHQVANDLNIDGYYVVKNNDFIYNPRVSSYAPVGPIKRNRLEDGIMSPLYTAFRFKDGDLDFFESYFESSGWYKYIHSVSNIGARHDRMNITNDDFEKLPVPFPCKREQQKIAAFLGAVDEKIAQLQKKKDLLEEYKKGCMQKLFSQQLRFSDDSGSTFPDWEQTTIGDAGHFYYGKSAPKSSITEDAETPCVRYGELYTTYDERIQKIRSYTNIEPKNLKLSKGGEVLVPRVGEDPRDFANCSYLPHANVAIGEMISVYNTENNGLFMAYYFNACCIKEFARVVEGSNPANLYFAVLEPIQISIPCYEEQEKIADFLSAIDDKIALVAEELDKAKAFKKGLLQRMFV